MTRFHGLEVLGGMLSFSRSR